MGRGFHIQWEGCEIIPWIGVRYSMDRGFKIIWERVRYTMGKGSIYHGQGRLEIPYVEGSIYNGYVVQNAMGKR